LKGIGVTKDPKRAMQLFRTAAKAGLPDAQFAVGLCYDKGEGVPQSFAQAIYWYQKAADQGSASALTNLGVLYATGLGAAKDPSRAFQLFSAAAESGSPRALTNLAYLYYTGEGVARDRVTAYSWFEIRFEISATYGEPVDHARVNLASKLTSAEIEQARQRARQWISQHGAAFRDLPFRSSILARTDNQ
jgi:hypothetical protein